MRFLSVLVIAIAVLIHGPAMAEEASPKALLYKNPQCGCCEGHAYFLRKAGFDVTVKATHDLLLIKQKYGVPEHLEGCHTTLIEGYVIEGHVPIAAINRLLAERPDIRGISLPGMPAGSLGMTGDKTEPFVIYEITDDGSERVFAIE